MIAVRAARTEDRPAVEALLVSARLVLDGVDEHFSRFVVAEESCEVVGAAGLEVHGDCGLLRSVVVAPHASKRGIGRLLTRAVLQDAGRRGQRDVYLLTTTAADYFAQLGFERVEHQDLPPVLFGSKELQGACPASAKVMRRKAAPEDCLRPPADIDVLVSGGNDGNP